VLLEVLATPDFGAGAAISGFICLAWAIVLALVVLAGVWGTKRLQAKSRATRWYGGVVLVLCALVPLSCWFGPSLVVRYSYGNYPLGTYPDNKIEKGMTGEEVEAILGKPHERHDGPDGERWFYWIDSFGISWFGVDFGHDGRVTHTFGD
jgi:hypothetical protein